MVRATYTTEQPSPLSDGPYREAAPKPPREKVFVFSGVIHFVNGEKVYKTIAKGTEEETAEARGAFLDMWESNLTKPRTEIVREGNRLLVVAHITHVGVGRREISDLLERDRRLWPAPDDDDF